MTSKDFFKRFENVNHLFRLLLLYIFILAGFLFVRRYWIPESYGKLGEYRAASPHEIAASPVIYQGDSSCKACHAQQFEEKIKSTHRVLRCEVCHGPGNKHIESPVEFKMSKNKERESCLICHRQDSSRPKSFAQVQPVDHNPGMWCITCHQPHRPRM